MVVHVCNPIIWEVETGGSETLSQAWQRIHFDATLGYIRSYKERKGGRKRGREVGSNKARILFGIHIQQETCNKNLFQKILLIQFKS